MRLSAKDKARFIEQFQDHNLEMRDLERIWGHPSGTLYRWGFELNVRRPKLKGQVQLALEQVKQFCEEVSRELPPAVRIPSTTRLDFGKGDFVEPILYLTDLHFGRLTESFNAEVASARMAVLAVRLGNLVTLLRQHYTVHNLRIFALGDYVVGENIGRNITLEELEQGVLQQVYGLCVPQLMLFTDFIAPMFQTINIHAVRGNHGALSKWGPSKSANWDTVAYLAWEAKAGAKAGSDIRFDIETVNFYKYVEVMGKTHLLVHGDQMPAGSGSPYNSIKAKLDRWHTSMPRPFDYVAMGHFHQFAKVGEAYIG